METENAPAVAEESAAPAVSDEGILAELAAMREAEEKPETEEESQEEDISEDQDEGEDEDSEDEDLEEEDLDDDDDDDEDLEDEEDDEPEEKNLKGLAKIKAAEKAFNRRMKAQREELQADKDQWLERVQAAEKIAESQANYKSLANSNPVALFEDLGIEGSEAFQALGKYFFQYGKGIAPDAKPADRQAAESIRRLREQTAGLQQTKAEIAELKKKLDEKDQAANHRAEIEAYQAKLERIASKKFPLASRILGSKAKEEARAQMLEIAKSIARKTGQAPAASKVLKRYEAAETLRLEALGVDVAAFTKKATTKKKPEEAAKTKPVKTKPQHENNMPESGELDPHEQILRELQEARERGEVV